MSEKGRSTARKTEGMTLGCCLGCLPQWALHVCYQVTNPDWHVCTPLLPPTTSPSKPSAFCMANAQYRSSRLCLWLDWQAPRVVMRKGLSSSTSPFS